jgi:hypothetical protein
MALLNTASAATSILQSSQPMALRSSASTQGRTRLASRLRHSNRRDARLVVQRSPTVVPLGTVTQFNEKGFGCSGGYRYPQL